MDRTRSIAVLDQMVLDKAIDGDIVAVQRNNYDAFQRIRSLPQELYERSYNSLFHFYYINEIKME